MSTMKHTPTPWEQHGNEIIGGLGTNKSCVIFKIAFGHESPAPVFDYLIANDDEVALANANAGFAIRAINAHEALVAACEAFVSHISGDDSDYNNLNAWFKPEMQAARAALAVAKGAADETK